MKKYYKVSFQYSESVYCSNIAHAETAADVEAHYSKYPWYSVEEAASYEVEEATCKGMPIIEVEPAQVEKEALNEQKEDGLTFKPVHYTRLVTGLKRRYVLPLQPNPDRIK